jgi:NAD(P)-dependent dehydrogenase (short-subunit alcohol dehydrogenase family)
MAASLKDKTVVVIGRGSGIARAITDAARDEGANVIVAGRRPERLAADYASDAGVRVESVDLNDDASIDALAARVGTIDHLISTASARARGKLGDLEREAVRRSFDTKVIGPLMLARAFRDQINAGGSILLFSGVAAFKIEIGTLAVAITNGASDTLTAHWRSSSRRSASTRSRRASSTPAPGTPTIPTRQSARLSPTRGVHRCPTSTPT